MRSKTPYNVDLWFDSEISDFCPRVIITVAYLRLLYMKGFKSKLDRYVLDSSYDNEYVLSTNHFSIFLAVVIFQSVVSTGHMAACLKLAIDGLVYAQDSVAYFVNAATPAHVVQSALYVTNVSDSLHISPLSFSYNTATPEYLGRWGSGVLQYSLSMLFRAHLDLIRSGVCMLSGTRAT